MMEIIGYEGSGNRVEKSALAMFVCVDATLLILIGVESKALSISRTTY